MDLFKNGTLCRPAINECDYDEFCNGIVGIIVMIFFVTIFYEFFLKFLNNFGLFYFGPNFWALVIVQFIFCNFSRIFFIGLN